MKCRLQATPSGLIRSSKPLLVSVPACQCAGRQRPIAVGKITVRKITGLAGQNRFAARGVINGVQSVRIASPMPT
jgi:hypothetical protein